MDKKVHINKLLTNYCENKSDKASFDALMSLLDGLDDDSFKNSVQAVLDQIKEGEVDEYTQYHIEKTRQSITSIIEQQQQEESKVPKGLLWKVSIPIAAAIAVFFIFRNVFQQKNQISGDDKQEIVDALPGQSKASIIVDGQVIELDGDKEGIALSGGKVTYLDGSSVGVEQRKAKKLTVVTPKGGQYQIELSDGTKVWLNAESEMSYSTDFAVNNRNVDVKGEVYFEVAKSKTHPFTVFYGSHKAVVLGTKFNIHAYEDDIDMKTTLVEGALRVEGPSEQQLLRPNDQLVFDSKRKVSSVEKVNAASVISWKNGVFDLHELSLVETMRIISRWYDVEVIYTSEMPDMILGGKMSKGVRLSTFLKFLEENFSIKSEISKDQTLKIGRQN